MESTELIQMQLFTDEAEKIRAEAARTSVRGAVLSHLRQAAESLPGGRFSDGRTPEEAVARLYEGMNSMLDSRPPTGHVFANRLRAGMRRIIASQEMDEDQAKRYVAVVGALLDEMTGGAARTDSSQGPEGFEKKIRERMNRYGYLPLAEQIDRLIGETDPALEPALTRTCYMSVLQTVLRPMGAADRHNALSDITALCAERENAIIAAALDYEKAAADPAAGRTYLDPAAFAVSAAYGLSVTNACALELSGLMSEEQALRTISQDQEDLCTAGATLAGCAALVGGLVGTIGLSAAIAASYELLGVLAAVAGCVSSVLLFVAAACAADAVFTEIAEAWNTARIIRSLSPETYVPEDDEETGPYWDEDWERDVFYQLD